MLPPSSPVAYPFSSSPPPVKEKRRRSHCLDPLPEPKRRWLGRDNESLKGRPPFRQPTLGSTRSALGHIEPNFLLTSTSKSPFDDDDDDDDDDDEQVPTSLRAAGPLGKERITRAVASPGDISETSLVRDETQRVSRKLPQVKTSSGKSFNISEKKAQTPISYEQLAASRSKPISGRAAKSFYGIEIHTLLDEADNESKNVKGATRVIHPELPCPSVISPISSRGSQKCRTMLWTEKYRAKRFTDLVGDERTHREVLRWLKKWDPIVFPGISKRKPKYMLGGDEAEYGQHRKILMLTGPPGLGKTTLAHVCARQAGYEVVEINASDDRSRDIVRGRIRDCVGTENVRGVKVNEGGSTSRKSGRPVCVIVDEVDGAVNGSGGSGEGGFVKALIDMALLDEKNSNVLGSASNNSNKSKKAVDRFRLLRPMILICNDVYHPALRLLRSSTMAEIIHLRRPPLDKVVTRLKSVFEAEGLPCDGDGVRRLCEATWGLSNGRESRSHSIGTGEGDMRGILVVGEWVATKMRVSAEKGTRLTKKLVEEHMIENLAHGGGGSRGSGGGGTKETVERVFVEGAGFPKSTSTLAAEGFSQAKNADSMGVSELGRRAAMDRLRELVDTSGESDRIITDCFASYPSHQWQDDTFLSKPNAAYEWLAFHDRLSSRVHLGQEWELGSYLSQSVLGFHYLFASPARQTWTSEYKRWDEDEEEPPAFSGPKADYLASDSLKQNKAVLGGLQSSLSIPLLRSFGSAEDISIDLLPHLIMLLNPNVKPIVAGGSGDQRGIVTVRKEGEREMIQRAVAVMSAVGVTFERARVEAGQSGIGSFIYRMEPPLDDLATFGTAFQNSPTAPARFAIRQALDQEYQKYLIRQTAFARQARYQAGGGPDADTEISSGCKETIDDAADAKGPKIAAAKRDFFGRFITEARRGCKDETGIEDAGLPRLGGRTNKMVWVSFHEGFSNAVRKPITLEELIRGF